MNKRDLVKNVALKSHIVQSDVSEIITLALEELSTAFSNNENVTLAGFGTFIVETKEEREFVNPATHQTTTIPRTPVVKFHLSDKLRNEIRKTIQVESRR